MNIRPAVTIITQAGTPAVASTPLRCSSCRTEFSSSRTSPAVGHVHEGTPAQQITAERLVMIVVEGIGHVGADADAGRHSVAAVEIQHAVVGHRAGIRAGEPVECAHPPEARGAEDAIAVVRLSLIHISEPTRLL